VKSKKVLDKWQKKIIGFSTMKKQYKIEGQSAEHAMSDPADTNRSE